MQEMRPSGRREASWVTPLYSDTRLFSPGSTRPSSSSILRVMLPTRGLGCPDPAKDPARQPDSGLGQVACMTVWSLACDRQRVALSPRSHSCCQALQPYWNPQPACSVMQRWPTCSSAGRMELDAQALCRCRQPCGPGMPPPSLKMMGLCTSLWAPMPEPCQPCSRKQPLTSFAGWAVALLLHGRAGTLDQHTVLIGVCVAAFPLCVRRGPIGCLAA